MASAAAAAVLQCVLIYLIMAEGGFYFMDVFISLLQPRKTGKDGAIF